MNIIQQGTQQNILKILEARFPISEEIKEKIYAQQDLEMLDTWFQYAVNATSLKEFMAKIF